MVECDSFNQDDLLQAFKGAQAVFGQTPHAIPGDVELRAAKAQAAAAAAVGVESFIFSSLENVERRSQVITLISLVGHESSRRKPLCAVPCTTLFLFMNLPK